MPTLLEGKLLGLPKWVWAVAIGGGIIGAIYLRRRGASGAGDTADATDAVDGSSTDGTGADSTFASEGDFGSVGNGGAGGFNEAPPPAWSVGFNANGHLDPALKRELNRMIAKQIEEDKKDKHKRRRERNKSARTGIRQNPNPPSTGGNPPRLATTHFVQ